ncbi:P22 phage major capsid protein family protein [Polaromonas sp. YR568]|uniref:P22 phage major capsid protein family protein n=1 Tax=Polaromonas sp. YR568 TaxID=1855301 RepID=UPI00313770A6
MANTLTFIDMVAREALAVAHEKTQFIGTTDRQYDDSFGKTGAKIGSSLRVRNPNQYTRRQGSRVMDVQDQAESTQTITVATQDGVDMRFNSAELALDTDNVNDVAAFTKRYIEPAVSAMISGIEADYLAFATKATYNVAGTAGTAITSLVAPGAARAKLNQGLAPKSDRYIQMDSVTMGGLVNGTAAYFAPNGDISKQFREGMVARTAMADYYENERIWTLTNSDDVTASSNAAAGVTDGGNTIKIYTDLPIAKQTVGSVFTIAGVYACHPETKAAYANLQQFTITVADPGTSGTTVSPAIYLTGAKKNVSSSTGGDLATTAFNSQVLTFQGNASTSYAQPLMYHKDAFQFITADLPLMDDAHKCARRVQEGLSLRVWQASDIRNDEMLMRIDMLYGMAALRPAWASRMIGAAAA